jgi:hypothetical protein
MDLVFFVPKTESLLTLLVPATFPATLFPYKEGKPLQVPGTNDGIPDSGTGKFTHLPRSAKQAARQGQDGIEDALPQTWLPS